MVLGFRAVTQAEDLLFDALATTPGRHLVPLAEARS